MGRPRREAPPPLEGNDRVIILTCMTGWAIALVTLLVLRDRMTPSSQWWIWTCAVGVGLGLFALVYVPRLKRSRARAAERREAATNQAAAGQEQASAGPVKH